MTGPLITLRRPAPDEVRAFIEAQRSDSFTYPTVGMTTSGQAPDGYVVDDNTVDLGVGDEVFERARSALRRWATFELGWVTLVGIESPPPIAVGTAVAIVARRLRITFANVCRIAVVIEQRDRYGFAYGTLGAHVESGEERFLVTRSDDGAVSFAIRAYSKPAHWMTKLGYIYARRSQARFARESMAAMVRAVRVEGDRHRRSTGSMGTLRQ